VRQQPSLHHPSRNVVNQCLAEIEREEWEQDEALRRFYAREGKPRLRKAPVRVSLFKFAIVVFVLALAALITIVEITSKLQQ
jgi:hypothetical protein